MHDIQLEEVQYCKHCGSTNKKSAVICIECGKKIHTKYLPFYDFIKKHTKEELAGKVQDTIFSYVKNFLLSHVYGTILTVTIVAATVSAVYAEAPYIEKVTETKEAGTQSVSVPMVEEEQEQEQEIKALTDDDLYAFLHLSSNYDGFVDLQRASEGYWDQSVSYYNSVGEMYAENNIEGYSYGGVHEMIANPIPMHMLDVDPNFEVDEYAAFGSDRYSDEASAVTGEDCTSDIAKALLRDGYRVAECNYVLAEVAGDYDYDTHTGADVIKKLVYKMVYVEYEGEWYIAEDRLIQRVNV